MLPKDEDELSVYRIDGLETAEIWDLGEKYVVGDSGRDMKARASIKTIEVRKQSLDVSPFPHPHWRHANIIGWPDRSEESLIQLHAIELAEAATYHPPGE